VLTAIAVLLTEDKRYVDTVRRGLRSSGGAAMPLRGRGLSVVLSPRSLTRRCARRFPCSAPAPAAPHVLAQPARHLRGGAAGGVAPALGAQRRVLSWQRGRTGTWVPAHT
jgi:hypothetical protein